MKSKNNRMRQWIMGSALILVLVLVWSIHVYSPLQDQRDELEADLLKATSEYDLLKQRFKTLSEKEQTRPDIEQAPVEISRLVIQGSSQEDVSAHTQQWAQEFLQNYDLSLRSYKGFSPAKWQEYPLSRVEFQLSASTQGLSDLLGDLETIKKALRIEKLSVNYRRSKENDLRVSLHLGTLFVEGIKE